MEPVPLSYPSPHGTAANFPYQEEPDLFGKIGTKMENVARDFTAEVPVSKAKTEIHTLREGQMGSYYMVPPVGPISQLWAEARWTLQDAKG